MPIDQPPATSGYIETVPSFQSFRGPNYFILSGPDGVELVRINAKDGAITYGPNYRPDIAAQVFWSAISSEYRDFLAWKSEHGK